MPEQATVSSATALATRYRQKTPGSARLHRRAVRLFPNGTTHVARYLRPYPLYVEQAAGARKWDVDGNEYVDYFGGHGALILGHAHPEVGAAVERQIARGNHFGAEHEAALEWAELICEMVPCAERVRFTSSGTEATQLALRLARAFTSKTKIVRFAGHFHGWHDQLAQAAPDTAAPAGIPSAVAAETIILEPNDTAALENLLARRDDVAAVILEPTGAGFGRIPTRGGTLRALREITSRHAVTLIFDEVITGFRVSPGGAQQHYGVTPDLAALAKIVAGGYNGAAVVGRKPYFDCLEFHEAEGSVEPPGAPHQGTFNASPVSAVAGIATLRLLREGGFIESANELANSIRREMNAELRRRGMGWCVYGEFSSFHMLPLEGVAESPDDVYSGNVPWSTLKSGTPAGLSQQLRLGFLCGGVDIAGWPGGLVSGVHTGQDVELTLTAFAKTLDLLRNPAAAMA